MQNFTIGENIQLLNRLEINHESIKKNVNRDTAAPIQVVSDRKWLDLIPSAVKEQIDLKKYNFFTFYHPYVCSMIKELNRKGIEGVLNPVGDTPDSIKLQRQMAEDSLEFINNYLPNNHVVNNDVPKEVFDFNVDSPYGTYNWELFFHIPLLIANRLSQNQKFEEAQKWYHYIFDPTETLGEKPARYWKVKPFFEELNDRGLDDILNQVVGADSQFNRSLSEWVKNPFQPHAVARLRIVAYMKHTMIKYLDNLIAWGDFLFAQDSIESINEATQLYILASQILGDRPVAVNKKGFTPKKIKDAINGSVVTDRMLALENALGDIKIGDEQTTEGINSLTSILLFCTPANSRVLNYWDTIADRLFKIRNCQNLEGITRSLALFQPPIDPALLVRANAAGLDISTVLNNVSGSNLPHYRCRFLIQKAIELCNDVKSLGSNLLSVLEKQDAEDLALLRASQEKNLLKAFRVVRQQAIDESKETLSSLEDAKILAEKRLKYYSSREFMNSEESGQLNRMEKAINLQKDSHVVSIIASTSALIADIQLGGAGISSPYATAKYGGANIFNALEGTSKVLSALSNIENFQASKSGITGGYQRRQDDWDFQAELATTEISQLEKQIVGGQIRLAMNERELQNHDLQTTQSEEIETFLKEKYTNKSLYGWMRGQIAIMYRQSYQLALDVARMAEQAFRYERALEDTPPFITFNYWDSLKSGLLSGERLERDLRRMEIAFIEQNKREYEISKNISLNQLAPEQLQRLKTRGVCDFYLPEVLFDLDHPGQYMRRIKSVNLTIPCVTGPYTNVNAKLILLSSFTRKNTKLLNGEYPRQPAGENGMEDRFRENYGSVQAIATSRAQNDAGLFELNFQDERYLPFEGAGVISNWRLEMPDQFQQFDYDTISDVIIQVNYMAREGGEQFKNAAQANIQTSLNKIADELSTNETGLERLFSLKTHFPNQFHQLVNDDANLASIDITQNQFPFFTNGKNISFLDGNNNNDAVIMVKFKVEPTASVNVKFSLGTLSGDGFLLTKNVNKNMPDLYMANISIANDDVIGQWKLQLIEEENGISFGNDSVEDIFILFNYKLS